MLKFCLYCGNAKTANNNRRYIVIGDIHGCLNELKQLWNSLKITHNDKVIFLGDLVDKGPDSDGVVTFVREKKEAGYKITLVEGNHEEKNINRYYKADRGEYDENNPYISDENISFLETAIPYFKFTSGDKNFTCVHGGFYPAFKNVYNYDLMSNEDIDKFYSGTRNTEKAINLLNKTLNVLKADQNRINKLDKSSRTPEDKESLKILPGKIEAIKNQIDDIKKEHSISKETKEFIKRLKRFFITRYVDEDGHIIPTDPETLAPIKEGTFWTDLYNGEYGTVFYGHEPYEDIKSTRHTHGIDTGVVYGGKLTAAVVQNGEIQFSNVKAERAYQQTHKMGSFKQATIHPPFEAVRAISNLFMPTFSQILEEYRESILEEELGGEEVSEEELNSCFSKSDFSQALENFLIMESYNGHFEMRMPRIDLQAMGPRKNREVLERAQAILDSINVRYTGEDGGGLGSVAILGPHRLAMKLFPAAIVNDLPNYTDFDNITEMFKRELNATISHELIHAIQFAYEHAPLPDSLNENSEHEDEEDYYDFFSEDDEEDIAFERYKKLRHNNKLLPWHSQNKLDKYRDYNNRRVELQAHPTNLALGTFDSLIDVISSEIASEDKSLIAQKLETISDSELGSKLLWMFKNIPLSNPAPYKQLIRKDKKKEFLAHSFKRLKNIIASYVRRNALD